MPDTGMTLKVLVPHQVHVQCAAVQRVVVQTLQGSMGILPHRRDCVAILVPGLLCYQLPGEAEHYVAVDSGVLTKTGAQLCISARNAVSGVDLTMLKQQVERQFLQQNEQERLLRAELLKLESGFVRRYLEFRRGR